MHLVFVGFILAAIMALVTSLTPALWIWGLCLLWSALFGLLNYAPYSKTDRGRVLARLTEIDSFFLYTALVKRMRRTLAHMMAPPMASDTPMPNERLWRFFWYLKPRAQDKVDLNLLRNNTFSWPVLDLALKLAVIYTLYFILAQWAVSGELNSLPDDPIYWDDSKLWLRAATFGLTTLYLSCALLASATQQQKIISAAGWLLFATLVFGFTFLNIHAVTGGAPYAIASFLALLSLWNGAAAVVVSVSVGLLDAVLPLVSFPIALAGLTWLGYRVSKGGGLRPYFAIMAISIAAPSIAIILSASQDSNYAMLSFVFAIVPVANSLFDYLSYGLTLHLINKGWHAQNGRIALYWLFDVFCAVLILLGLSTTLCLIAVTLNAVSDTTVIDLPAIFAGMKDPITRPNYAWLYLCLLSTLVPTVVHTIIMLLSAFTWVPMQFKSYIARLIVPDHDGKLAILWGTGIAATLGTLCVGVFGLGLWAIYHFFAAGFTPFALWLLTTVEMILHTIGAL